MLLHRLNRTLLLTFRLHQILFLVLLMVMMIVDFFFLEGWATFWPMIIWSAIFGIHFMIFRAQSVDDKWVRERLIFNIYRPWDTGHVEAIRERPFGKSIYRTEIGRIDEQGKPRNTDKADKPASDGGS